MNPSEVVLEGRGLHSGCRARVILRRRLGPVTLDAGHGQVPLAEATIVATDRSTTIEVAGDSIATVEHLLSALGGLGIHEGVSIEVTGPEVPLMDGGARAFCDALTQLGASHGAPALVVVRSGQVEVDASRYEFGPGRETELSVSVDFGDPRIAGDAVWRGDPRDFHERISPARTFGFARELEALAGRGLASHVSPESVVLYGPDVLSAGRPVAADEPARHKLLDLTGDLFLHGGPPRGALHVHRPGHGATRAAMRIAFEQGIVTRVGTNA